MARVVEFGPRPYAGALTRERPALVAIWHERARQLGLSERLHPDFGSVSRAELARLAEQHRSLFTHAVPVMETLHEQILNTHSMVILTDSSGLILHALGDADFLAKADRVALRPGVTWSEVSKGTNAIGTALTDGRPTLVHGSEHFLTVNRFLTCSCSPIRDPHGRVIGGLDVSGPKESYHAHTMALVRMSTQMIENHLFVDRFGHAVRLHFHLRPEFLGTIAEGIAAFDESGRFVAVNAAGEAQLGESAEALRSHTLPSLFGITLTGLIDRCRTAEPGLLSLCLHNGVRVSARAQLAQTSARGVPYRDGLRAPDLKPEVRTPAPQTKGAYTLRDLDTGEPAVASVVAKLRKVQRHEIPILILGETGTGKEVLAQAIHNESHRRAQPFVAVDCAAIPESLIETELFGYEEGAFTGARRRGSHGRILSANGGTLFLDEIGDMPLTLQSRLLRVLQERTVVALGGSRAIPVNIAVICATHRNLREMIHGGAFREDLYYRLNGLAVRLPPLRERGDILALARSILASECAVATPLRLSAEVQALFLRYRWPGNLRQLANVLRTAAVMAADEGAIEMRHLPEDFIEELQGAAPQAVTRAALPPAARAHRAGNLRDLRGSAIRAALDEARGNISAAARALGVSRNTIYRALRPPRD